MTWIDLYVVIFTAVATVASCAALVAVFFSTLLDAVDWWRSDERWYSARFFAAALTLLVLAAAILATGVWVIDGAMPDSRQILR